MWSPHPVTGQSVKRRTYNLKVDESGASLTEVQNVGWTFDFPSPGVIKTNWQYKTDWSVKYYRRVGPTDFVLTNLLTGVSDTRLPDQVTWTSRSEGLGDSAVFDPPMLVGTVYSTNAGTFPFEMPMYSKTTGIAKWRIVNDSPGSVPYKIQFWGESPSGTVFAIDFALGIGADVMYAFGPELANSRFPEQGYFYRYLPFFQSIRPLNQAEIALLDDEQIIPLAPQGEDSGTGNLQVEGSQEE